ncbi:MAG: hypothetical protein JWN00_5746 [Actinomycetia bacterium]|nr:hypothetical protein [Actinomycetes bacterium]
MRLRPVALAVVAVFDKTGRWYAEYGRNTKTLTSDSLAKAWEFMQLNARLIDRHRFAFHFRDGAAGPVRSALAPYRNANPASGRSLYTFHAYHPEPAADRCTGLDH